MFLIELELKSVSMYDYWQYKPKLIFVISKIRVYGYSVKEKVMAIRVRYLGLLKAFKSRYKSANAINNKRYNKPRNIKL